MTSHPGLSIRLLTIGIVICAAVGSLWAQTGNPGPQAPSPVAHDNPSAADTAAPDLIDELLADPAVKIGEIVCTALPNNSPGHAYETFGYRANLPKPCPTSVGDLVGGVTGGRLLRLNLRSGRTATILEDAGGAIRDPCVHYDGRTILFSYRKAGSMSYHLYQIQADGSGLVQLTDGIYDDIEPCYLPDGGIVFVSSRSQRWVPCFSTQCGNIYRCDGDGRNLVRLSANVDHDLLPWVFPDGRIVYTRWEYVDRHEDGDWSPWVMRPDGCGLVSLFGHGIRKSLEDAYMDLKPIPGTGLAVAVQAHKNVTQRNGPVVLLDMSLGPQNTKGVLRQLRGLNGSPAPGFSPAVPAGTYRDPWPLSARWFLLVNGEGIWLADDERGRRQLVLANPEVPGPTSGKRAVGGPPLYRQPRALLPHPREPVLVQNTAWNQATGRLFVSDVYHGRGSNGIRRGEISKIMVYEILPDPIHHEGAPGQISMSSAWNIKRLLGTFPVEDDGSAYVEVPALRALQFIALDAAGLGIKRMHAFTSVMPGETQSCSGCHEPRTETPGSGSSRLALRRPPSHLDREGLPDIIDYPKHIQPIWDRHCVKCHNPGQMKGKLDLSGHRGTYWSHSSYNLIANGYVRSTGARGPANPPPRTMGSPASPLLDQLRGKHHAARLSDVEFLLVVRWIDAGTPYAGTYACSGTGKGGDAQVPQDIAQQRCATCHRRSDGGWVFNSARLKRARYAGAPERREDFSNDDSLVDLTEPAKSLIVMAPLAVEAGGLGWCRAPDGAPTAVFATTDDPDYRRILARIRSGLNSFEVPGFSPHPAYFREMIRYGILPPTFDPLTDPYDTYELDRWYYDQQYPPFPDVSARTAQ